MRSIDHNPKFQKNLKALSKKDRATPEDLERLLSDIAEHGPPPRADRIPNLKGSPTYKQRLGIGNSGTRSGIRVIYYCDSQRVVPLFAYSKGDSANVPTKQIASALRAAGLLPPD